MDNITKTLDLGCGARPKNPFNASVFYGVDIRDDLENNVKKADLFVESIPYDSDFFDYVTAFDFIEHIPRVVYCPDIRFSFVELMNEVYRVLKTGGIFLSFTPAFPHAVAFRDPTHVNIITEETFPLYFDDTVRNAWPLFKGYFKILSQEFKGPHLLTIMQKVDPPSSPSLSEQYKIDQDKKKISILIPVFNGAKYLEKLINSLKSQSYPYFEVLFADDFSSDDSLRVILDNTKYDERFKIIALDSKKGRSSKVVNFLYKHVLGDFVIYFSQDDFCDSKFLELLIDKFDSQLVDAVIPYVEMYYEGFPEKNFIIGKNIDRDNFITGSLACGLSLNWSIPGAALFRKTLIDKCNGWDEWAINSDEYSTRKFFLNCRYVSFCDGIFYYRQSNPDAVTKKITVDSFEWPYTELMVYKMIKENGFSDDFKSVSLQRAVRTFVFYCDMLSKNIVNYEEASFNLIKCYNLAKELNVDGFFCSNFKD